MKRNLILWAAIMMGVVGGVGARADQFRIDLVMRDYRLSRPDAAAAAMVSASLHFGERDVVYWARDCGRPIHDVGPAFVISYYTHRPVYEIWRGRHGRSWYDYGYDCGVDWDRFNRLGLGYDDFDRMVWLNLSNSAYGCDTYLWDDLSDQGLSFSDMIVTIVLGDGHRDRCDYYAYEYRHHDRDWGRFWDSARRDPRIWNGYRDRQWRERDRDRDRDRDWRDRDRDWRDRDRGSRVQSDGDRDRRIRDEQNRRDRDRLMQDQRDRIVRDQSRRERDRQMQDQRDRMMRDEQNRRDRQMQDQRDRIIRDEQGRRDRDRQMQDQRDRTVRDSGRRGQESRDSGRSRDNGRSNDRSKRDNSGRDRGGSRDRGR